MDILDLKTKYHNVARVKKKFFFFFCFLTSHFPLLCN